MKTKSASQDILKTLDMADLFQVEMVNGTKRVSRWGFFAKQDDGNYVIYKPEKPVCGVDELFMIDENGPGAIEIVSKNEIEAFVNEIANELKGVPAFSVSEKTPCGWYYDTLC